MKKDNKKIRQSVKNSDNSSTNRNSRNASTRKRLTTQDAFQKTNYKTQQTVANKQAAPARRRSVPTKTTPRYSNPKNTVHPDADDTPVTMQNPNYIPVTDNIQFRPLNYFGVEDPYGRTASEAFDAELAEQAARRQAVLDMYGIAPSGSSVSDLTSQYNYGKNMWW